MKQTQPVCDVLKADTGGTDVLLNGLLQLAALGRAHTHTVIANHKQKLTVKNGACDADMPIASLRFKAVVDGVFQNGLQDELYSFLLPR